MASVGMSILELHLLRDPTKNSASVIAMLEAQHVELTVQVERITDILPQKSHADVDAASSFWSQLKHRCWSNLHSVRP